MPRQTAAGDYSSACQLRDPFLRRARDASKLTIPALLPPLGHTVHSQLPTPFQGLGAQGVNNLASKLLLSLFPPTQPFFRLVPNDPEGLSKFGPEVKTEVEESLVRMERTVTSELEVMALRVKVFEALKHLVIAGNACLHIQPDGQSRVLSLEQYVVRRDPMGFLEKLIVREALHREHLPAELEKMLAQSGGSAPYTEPSAGGSSAESPRMADRGKELELFTVMEWDEDADAYRLHQEFARKVVPGSRQKFGEHLCPFRVLRFSAIDGEDYGRGLVEEVIGDLISLEALMRSIVEASAIMARVLFLVDPAGAATADDLDRAPNGAFRVGRETDVHAVQVQKGADLQITFKAVEMISSRLERAFLLNTAVQRQAERVTAEEIRYVAQELESTLGGVFSVLSQELQLPVVSLVMDRMGRQGRIPKINRRAIRPAIVTGIEALGRGQELNKIGTFAQAAQQIVGPDQLNQFMHVRVLLGQLATAAGIDTSELMRTEDEVAQQNQQARTLEMIQRLGPEALKQVGPGIAERMGLAPGGGQAQPQQPPPPATPARR